MSIEPNRFKGEDVLPADLAKALLRFPNSHPTKDVYSINECPEDSNNSFKRLLEGTIEYATELRDNEDSNDPYNMQPDFEKSMGDKIRDHADLFFDLLEVLKYLADGKPLPLSPTQRTAIQQGLLGIEILKDEDIKFSQNDLNHIRNPEASEHDANDTENTRSWYTNEYYALKNSVANYDNHIIPLFKRLASSLGIEIISDKRGL